MVDRVATEPEGRFGVDSMILPGAVLKGHVAAILEIELYQAVESAEAVHRNNYARAGRLVSALAGPLAFARAMGPTGRCGATGYLPGKGG